MVNREFVRCSIFRQQSEEKIGVAKPGPRYIAAKLVAFIHLRGQVSFDFVVHPSDEALEFSIGVGDRLVAFFRKKDLWNRGGSIRCLGGNLQINGVSRTRKDQLLGDHQPVGRLPLEKQSTFRVSCEIQIAALDRIKQSGIVIRRWPLPADS